MSVSCLLFLNFSVKNCAKNCRKLRNRNSKTSRVIPQRGTQHSSSHVMTPIWSPSIYWLASIQFNNTSWFINITMDFAEDQISKVKATRAEDESSQESRYSFFYFLRLSNTFSFLPHISHTSFASLLPFLVSLLMLKRSRDSSEEERKTVDTKDTSSSEENKGEYVSLQEQPAQGDTKLDLTQNDGFI